MMFEFTAHPRTAVVSFNTTGGSVGAWAFQTLIVPSSEAEIILSPAELIVQLRRAPVCPANVYQMSPVWASQVLRVRSSEAETIHVPSGLIAQACIAPVCPEKVRSSAPVRASQVLRV